MGGSVRFIKSRDKRFEKDIARHWRRKRTKRVYSIERIVLKGNDRDSRAGYASIFYSIVASVIVKGSAVICEPVNRCKVYCRWPGTRAPASCRLVTCHFATRF